jgi:hypothetical protein
MNVVTMNFRDYVTGPQAAAMMGVNMQYMYRLRQLKVLMPAGKTGFVNMYRKRDVERYMDSHPLLGLRADRA